MPASPYSYPYPGPTFVCDCRERMRSACAGEPFYKDHEHKSYCVLHFPCKEKGADFERVLQRKLENKDFNFCGVWFPDEVSFPDFEFETKADFSEATFSGVANFTFATFIREASFRQATFCAEAYFSRATFSAAAYFGRATFSTEAFFKLATFMAEASFNRAIFSAEAYFNGATFHGEASFSRTTFEDHAKFSGTENRQVFADTSALDLQFARIENPDRFSFHTIGLRPGWFVNIDPRRFDFINVNWGSLNLGDEIAALEKNRISSPHPLLAIACRNLAVNAEENHRYEDASKFRYMAMEARRLESWRGFVPWRLSWWYWLASGYGERVWQAFFVLLGILFLSALLYNHVGFARWEPKLASESDAAVARKDDVGAPLPFKRALPYSLGVMTLQRPEPKAATTAAQTVVLLETILGPVQAALLALAIRRKFMR